MSDSLFIVKRMRNKYTILPLRCRRIYFHMLGVNRIDLTVVFRGFSHTTQHQSIFHTNKPTNDYCK